MSDRANDVMTKLAMAKTDNVFFTNEDGNVISVEKIFWTDGEWLGLFRMNGEPMTFLETVNALCELGYCY